MSPPAVPTKYSEEDWNEISPKQVEEQGSNASPMTIYLASKTLAERAAWKYYDEIKSQVKWDLSVILPSFVRLSYIVFNLLHLLTPLTCRYMGYASSSMCS